MMYLAAPLFHRLLPPAASTGCFHRLLVTAEPLTEATAQAAAAARAAARAGVFTSA